MNTTINRAPLSVPEILRTAELITAARKGTKVTWAPWAPGEDPARADIAHLLTGIPRYVERTNRATGAIAASDDIRDQYLRITTTFEHWLLVSDVLAAMAAGTFVIGYEA